jgi:hypothetical protein
MQGLNKSSNQEVMVANAVLTTALLANEICIQTKGEFVLQEEDYIVVVKNFQVALSRKIMPVKTQADLKEEAKKYIADLLKQLSSGVENGESGNTSELKPESNGDSDSANK